MKGFILFFNCVSVCLFLLYSDSILKTIKTEEEYFYTVLTKSIENRVWSNKKAHKDQFVSLKIQNSQNQSCTLYYTEKSTQENNEIILRLIQLAEPYIRSSIGRKIDKENLLFIFEINKIFINKNKERSKLYKDHFHRILLKNEDVFNNSRGHVLYVLAKRALARCIDTKKNHE
jgi:hypothetical protein